MNLSQLSWNDKYHIMKAQPDPDTACYPCSRQCESGSLRQFQPSWIKKYPWLHYSRHVDGVFCLACVFFAPDKASGQILGQFVTTPFKSCIKMSEKATTHAKKDYHLFAMTKMNEYLSRYENPSQTVNTLLDNESRRIVENNRKVVESLLKIVLLCGKQGLALRGHRDDKLNWEDKCSFNEGNFIQLVRFRAETDPILANPLPALLGMPVTHQKPFRTN